MSPRKLLVAGFAFGIVNAATAQAQVSRVFVSVNGNDANVCSNIATPCRTIGGGITQVDAHGEVIVIDSGSYAGGTITKSVKIDVAAGAVAFSGLPIVSNPGGSGVVVIRGLTLKAATVGSGTGITHQSGTLMVENSVVDGWYDGISSQVSATQLYVRNGVFRNQVNNGVIVQFGTAVHVMIDGSVFDRNFFALDLEGGTGRISNTVLGGGNTGVFLDGGSAVDYLVEHCQISGTSYSGIHAMGNSNVRVSHSTISYTGFALWNDGATLFESLGNNLLRKNTANTTGSITTTSLQ